MGCLIKATSGFEPLDKGFADLSLATWVRRHNNDRLRLRLRLRNVLKEYFLWPNLNLSLNLFSLFGAGDGIRTRDPNLGKVVLYQLSYTRNSLTKKGIQKFIIFSTFLSINKHPLC